MRPLSPVAAPAPASPPAPARGNADRTARGARLILQGALVNLLLAGIKFTAGILGHTQALIADGAESLLDVVSSLVAWAGFKVAARPPDADHPYGHGKAEAVAGLAVAAFVLAMAGGIGFHAVQEILTPHRGPSWWTLPVLAGVVAIKLFLSRQLRAAGEQAGSQALQVESLHHWSDAVTSAAAAAGISLALLGGEGWAVADDWAALLACVVIAYNGVAIIRRALGDVMDAALPAGFEAEVRALALAVPGVRSLDKVRMRKSGFWHLVDLQVRVDGDLSVREGHAIAHAVKDALVASSVHAIADVTVHVEPTA